MVSTVVQDFKAHPLWSELAQFETVLSSTKEMLDENILEDASAHASLTALAEHIRAMLEGVNPVLVSTTTLDAIQSALAQCRTNVENFEEDSQTVYLMEAWKASTSVFASLNSLPVIKVKGDMRGVASAMATFDEQVAGRVVALAAELDKNKATFDELRAAEKALSDEITQQTGVLAAEIVTAKEERDTDKEMRDTTFATELETVQDALKVALDESMAIRAQERILRTTQMKEFQTKFAALQTEWDTRIEKAEDVRVACADEHITTLEKRLEEAQKLVGMLGEVTMTGHYQRNAVEQKKAADLWRRATVGAGIVAVLAAISLLFVGRLYPNDPKWYEYVSHAGVTLAIAGLATFLGEQSVRHRRREEKYRELELELAVIDPYLGSLEDAERRRLKAWLAPRYFVGVDPDGANFDDPPRWHPRPLRAALLRVISGHVTLSTKTRIESNADTPWYRVAARARLTTLGFRFVPYEGPLTLPSPLGRGFNG